MGLRDRIAHAWNAFTDRDERDLPRHGSYGEGGISSIRRSDRPTIRFSNEKSIVSSIYTRIAIDVASVQMLHVRTDDQKRFREFLRHHGVAIGPDEIAVGFEPGKFTGPRAGGEDNVLGRIIRGLTVLDDRDRPLALQLSLTVNDGDLVLLHQALDAARKLGRHFSGAFDDFAEVEFEIVGRKSEFVQPVHQVPDLGRAKQRLGRDAAPVKADAAEIFALHQGCFEPELRAADGADISARPAANDDDVEGFSHR